MSDDPHGPRYDDDDSPVDRAIASAVCDGFNDALDDSGRPPDTFLVRWMKFLSIIFVLATLVGAGFALEEYFMQSCGATWQRRSLAEGRVELDSSSAFQTRFILGACLGGSIGAAYVARCLVRKTDP